ncbi:MAG: hypothetical protein QG673_1024 [Pseudomonadota bacterium]|nr:hypothetical protein [Pseudomonadota bacterium]
MGILQHQTSIATSVNINANGNKQLGEHEKVQLAKDIRVALGKLKDNYNNTEAYFNLEKMISSGSVKDFNSEEDKKLLANCYLHLGNACVLTNNTGKLVSYYEQAWKYCDDVIIDNASHVIKNIINENVGGRNSLLLLIKTGIKKLVKGQLNPHSKVPYNNLSIEQLIKLIELCDPLVKLQEIVGHENNEPCYEKELLSLTGLWHKLN